MTTFRNAFCCMVCLSFVTLGASVASAGPLDRWHVSCSVDRGSILHRGSDWIFRTSSNHCPGGIFNQRAEISSDHINVSHRGNYLFETTIAMTTASTERFAVFQIHDGRMGCAPPLKLDVEPNGAISLTSDIKTGPGESCIRGAISEQSRNGVIRRDGTSHALRVLLEFDGTGSFTATVWVDGTAHLSGRYEIQTGQYRPESYYFKHGVYSLNMFDYELVSSGMDVRAVQVNR